MELELENIIKYPKIHKKYTRKSGFRNWTTKIGPIEYKLKCKNYRSPDKSCPRMKIMQMAQQMAQQMCCAICMIFHSWA
jgi:hypothetical protein